MGSAGILAVCQAFGRLLQRRRKQGEESGGAAAADLGYKGLGLMLLDYNLGEIGMVISTSFLLELPIILSHLNPFYMKSKAEVSQVEDSIRKLQQEINSAQLNATRLNEEERKLSEELQGIIKNIGDIGKEIEEDGRRFNQLKCQIDDLRRRQHDKDSLPCVVCFDAATGSDCWSVAIDYALGRLLDAFIVSCHKDSLVLRECAKEANYRNLQIIIYDFAKPRVEIPDHLLPSTPHPTVLSVIHSENLTILNVLVVQRIRNLKEVYASDGCKMFCRGPVQTTIPPNGNWRAGRLCTSLEEKITEMEQEATEIRQINSERLDRKRKLVADRESIDLELRRLKKKRENEELNLERKKAQLDETKKNSIDNSHAAAVDTSELVAEMMQVKENIGNQELALQKINLELTDALQEENNRRASYKDFIESANARNISALCFPVLAGPFSSNVEAYLDAFQARLAHAGRLSPDQQAQLFTGGLPDHIRVDVELHDPRDLQQAMRLARAYERRNGPQQLALPAPPARPRRRALTAATASSSASAVEYFEKASTICAESEVQALGGVDGSIEQLSARITKLKQKVQQESRRYTETIDDLRALHDKKGQKILRKQQMYTGFRDKLNACQKALDLQWKKFQRNTGLLKRQLTWLFNEHLGKKGISGHINVDYKNEVLSVEKAPFRAMDEFDVFMDAVSRKISLGTLVEFVVEQGSQWIFITPHDISMVKAGDRIKKQQMATPRG
ncbi:unnamed protein product [Miscanthus lutarioriparius]|uniref:Uncharacterized protein n=1 Tax=Miscanthus lutarioriparius TaxID=422564 RepID=A0A811N878_9POAL|nr:unnamed protein product [Miscanthus lutarioriparius]